MKNSFIAFLSNESVESLSAKNYCSMRKKMNALEKKLDICLESGLSFEDAIKYAFFAEFGIIGSDLVFYKITKGQLSVSYVTKFVWKSIDEITIYIDFCKNK